MWRSRKRCLDPFSSPNCYKWKRKTKRPVLRFYRLLAPISQTTILD